LNDASGPDLAIVQLEPSAGAEIWRYEFDGPGSPFSPTTESEEIRALVVDGAGDVFASGRILNPGDSGFNGDFVTMKLSGLDGSEIWRSEGSGHYLVPLNGDEAVALALDGAGNVAAAFNAEWRSLASIGGVAQVGLAAVYLTGNDASDVLPGSRLSVTETGGGLSLRLNVRRGVSMAPRSQSDPTIGGAMLELRNPGTGETTSVPLDVGGWRSVEGSTTFSGAKYLGALCRGTKLRMNGRMSIRCEGLQGFTLNEVAQGALAVRLTTGTGISARRYCMVFGGTVEQDGPGVFRAVDAPAPTSCPF
jgi:hypothetical protein